MEPTYIWANEPNQASVVPVLKSPLSRLHTPQEGSPMAFSGICKFSLTFLAHCGAFVCAGMPLMLCGHFFLKLSHAPEYQDATFPSSLQVGALGGLLMTIPMMILEWIIKSLQSFSLPKPSSSNNAEKQSIAETVATSTTVTKETPIAKDSASDLQLSIALGILQVFISIISVVGLGAGTGCLGSAVLKTTGHDVLGLLEATRAGAVGAAILGPGALVVVLVLFLCCCGTPFLALLFAQAMGGNKKESKAEANKAPDTKV